MKKVKASKGRRKKLLVGIRIDNVNLAKKGGGKVSLQ